MYLLLEQYWMHVGQFRIYISPFQAKISTLRFYFQNGLHGHLRCRKYPKIVATYFPWLTNDNIQLENDCKLVSELSRFGGHMCNERRRRWHH